MTLENASDHHSGPGPWFIAALDGACSCCGDDIVEGDEIRADGHGRWEGRECCGGEDEPTMTDGSAFSDTDTDDAEFAR